MPRKSNGDRPMTPAERTRRYRQRQRETLQAPVTETFQPPVTPSDKSPVTIALPAQREEWVENLLDGLAMLIDPTDAEGAMLVEALAAEFTPRDLDVIGVKLAMLRLRMIRPER